jgi:hypothetical protein
VLNEACSYYCIYSAGLQRSCFSSETFLKKKV